MYIVLVVFGWFNLYAANYNPETQVFFTTDAEYFRQLIWIGISVISVAAIMMLDSKFFVEASIVIYAVSLLLLVLVLFVGKETYGAKSWLQIGPFAFQPVEFTKMGTALVAARIMSRFGFQFNAQSYLKLFMLLIVPIVLVLLQNDTGSALIFFVFLLPMYREGVNGNILLMGLVAIALAVITLITSPLNVLVFVSVMGVLFVFWGFFRRGLVKDAFICVGIAVVVSGGMSLYMWLSATDAIDEEVVPIAGVFCMSVYALGRSIYKRCPFIRKVLMYVALGVVVSFSTGYAFENILQDHQRTRINVLLGIEEDPLGAGYNVNQSLIAIGSGGATGKGYLQGTQTKLNFVPKQSTDFIFCTVGEEWGFAGSAILVVIYLSFFVRIILLAEKQHSVFSRVYGYCIASILFFHFTVNICMTIGLMPVIGIPLPFFSYGGSSLWSFSIMLFIFLKLDTCRNELIR